MACCAASASQCDLTTLCWRADTGVKRWYVQPAMSRGLGRADRLILERLERWNREEPDKPVRMTALTAAILYELFVLYHGPVRGQER